jgi:ankyrin repeat protein
LDEQPPMPNDQRRAAEKPDGSAASFSASFSSAATDAAPDAAAEAAAVCALVNPSGFSALHWLVHNRNADVLCELAERGWLAVADSSVRSAAGETPLQLAVRQQREAMAAKDFAAAELSAACVELLQAQPTLWKQHVRPALFAAVGQEAQLPPSLVSLVLAYVDPRDGNGTNGGLQAVDTRSRSGSVCGRGSRRDTDRRSASRQASPRSQFAQPNQREFDDAATAAYATPIAAVTASAATSSVFVAPAAAAAAASAAFFSSRAAASSPHQSIGNARSSPSSVLLYDAQGDDED